MGCEKIPLSAESYYEGCELIFKKRRGVKRYHWASKSTHINTCLELKLIRIGKVFFYLSVSSTKSILHRIYFILIFSFIFISKFISSYEIFSISILNTYQSK